MKNQPKKGLFFKPQLSWRKEGKRTTGLTRRCSNGINLAVGLAESGEEIRDVHKKSWRGAMTGTGSGSRRLSFDEGNFRPGRGTEIK